MSDRTHLGTHARRPWDLCEAILTHALAGEACRCFLQLVPEGAADFADRARALLATSGSLSRFPTSGIRVFPKAQVASAGLTVRLPSRYLCAFAGPLDIR